MINKFDMRKIFLFLFSVICLTMVSCTSDLVGSWVEPSNSGEEQGFILNKDGSASSINMDYVEFKSWEREGDLLILRGNNTGSLKHEFSDTMTIENINDTELTLSDGGAYKVTYKRK